MTQSKQKSFPTGNLPPANKTEKLLDTILDPIHVVGKKVMGDLWWTFYLSIQDAIALSCLIKIPSFIFKLISGKDFNSFTACLPEDSWGPLRYACFVIVIAEFCLWAVLAARVLVRCIQDFMDLAKRQGGKHGSQP